MAHPIMMAPSSLDAPVNGYPSATDPPSCQPPQDGTTRLVTDLLIPTNPLAAIACWSGVISLLFFPFGWLLGPIGLGLGLYSRRHGAVVEQSSYGQTTASVRSWVGIITGALGLLAGIAFLLLVAFAR